MPNPIDHLIDRILSFPIDPAKVGPMREALAQGYPDSLRLAEIGDREVVWLGATLLAAVDAALDARDTTRLAGATARIVIAAYLLGRQAGQLALLPRADDPAR